MSHEMNVRYNMLRPTRSNLPWFQDCTFGFELRFDELQLFRKPLLGEMFYGVSCDGTASIEYDPDGDWWITTIELNTDNRKCGGDSRTRSVILPESDPLYDLITKAITNRYSSHVESVIDREMADAGYQRPTVRELVA